MLPHLLRYKAPRSFFRILIKNEVYISKPHKVVVGLCYLHDDQSQRTQYK